MNLLHTSDLHLAVEDDDRWKALVEIVSQTNGRSIDSLIISGDLFENELDAEALRAPLRAVFEGVDFETLIIPGNHDEEAFRAGLYFGERVRVLNDPDWSNNFIDKENVRIIGIPFEAIRADEFHRRLRELRDLIDPDRTNILLYHGELLDASFDREAFGPERGRYLPSRLTYFAELGIDYVLAGHFHSTFQVREFGEVGFFVYPGSPVSITRREVGRRSVALIEPGEAPRQIPLDTHYYEQVKVTLDAFSSDDPVEVVREHLKDIHPNAAVLLTVDGTIRDMQEQELRQAILEATAGMRVEESALEFRDLSHILRHPVYGLFEERLETMLVEGEKPISNNQADNLRKMLIRAMTRVRL